MIVTNLTAALNTQFSGIEQEKRTTSKPMIEEEIEKIKSGIILKESKRKRSGSGSHRVGGLGSKSG